MKPYGVISDLHLHSWSSFAVIDPDGVNGRLRGLLNEIKRCAAEVKKAGGDTIICAGDIFHVRGSVDPMVLNPAMDVFKEIVASGIRVVAISGNHDLANKSSSDLSSAITALKEVGVEVVSDEAGMMVTNPNVIMIPWFEDLNDLRQIIGEWAEDLNAITGPQDFDLCIHAPVNGVIKGLPDKGLSPKELADYGFRRVLSGHYHNHVVFENGKVVSIGALAHHTWSDPGSKAGFLIVSDEGVRWMKSHLPEFIDSNQLLGLDKSEIPMVVEGNYIRVKTDLSKTADLEKLRLEMLSYGAKGVIIQAEKKAEAVREGAVTASVSAGASLNVSIADFIKTKSYVEPTAVFNECEAALNEAEMEE